MNNAKIGAALLGGYLLGRTKKGKLALSVGAMLAGSRIRPGQVGKALQDSPFVHTLTDQVRSELTGAGKAAATSILTAKADSLADALHERTAGLREKGHGQEARGEEPEEETERDEEPREEPRKRTGRRAKAQRGTSAQASDQDEDQDADQDADGDEDRDEEQPRRRKTSAGRARSRSGGGGARSRGQDDG